MNRNDSAFIAQKIRAQYIEKEATELDALRALDAKVKRPAQIFSYIFGGLGAIVMGGGMSLVMTDIGATLGIESTMIPGIVIGIVGMAMALVNYPLYNRILDIRRKKYAQQVIEMSERITEN